MLDSMICPRCGGAKAFGIPGDLCPACVFATVLPFKADPAATGQPPKRVDSGPIQSKFLSGEGVREMPELIRYFGDYELLERIAEGGMGVVYKARQRSLGRFVAVKLIRAGRLADSRDVARFRTEAAAAARLKHPYIVPIHEIGEHDGLHYLCLDLLEGGSLAQEVLRHPLAPQRAASVVRTIADAIQYAHERGVLHRDLKPSNVLLDAWGSPHLTDFGLAKVIESGAQLTRSGEVFGTPSYISPEQAEGRKTEVGPASDVYSLGAILYELLTGRPPFAAATALETIRLVMSQEPSPPRLINPGLPRDLETICLKCLSKRPADRYQSALELGQDLDRFLQDEPIRAMPVGVFVRAWRWCRRKPSLAVAVGASALFLTVGLLTSVVLWRRSEHARMLSEHQSYAADVSAALVLENEGNLPAARSKLDLHRHQTNLHDFTWNYVESRVRGNQLGVFRGHSKAIDQIAISEDGKTVASKDVSGRLNVWDAGSFERRYSVDGIASLAGFIPGESGGLVIGTTNDAVQLRDRLDGRILRAKPEPGLPFLVRPGGGILVVRWFDGTGVGFEYLDLFSERPELLTAEDRKALAQHDPQLLEELLKSRAPKGAKPSLEALRPLALSEDGQTQASVRGKVWGRTHTSVSVLGPDRIGPVEIGIDPSWTRISLSPSGDRLLVGRADGYVERHDLTISTGQGIIPSLRSHSSGISALEFLSNGTEYVTGADDQSVKLWSFGSDRPVVTLLGVTERVVAIGASKDGNTVVSGGQHGELLLWDARARQCREAIPGIRMQGRLDRIVYSPDSRMIGMRSSKDGFPVLIDVESLLERDRIPIPALINFFSLDGTSISVGTTSDRRYSATTFGPLPSPTIEFRSVRSLLGAGDGVTNLLAKAVSMDRRFVGFSVLNQGVVVCDLETGKEVVRCPREGHDVCDLAFMKPENLLAMVDRSGRVSVWDVVARSRVARFESGPATLPVVLPLADGKRIVTGIGPNRIGIWSYPGGDTMGGMSGHRGEITSLAQSGDGKTLASGSADGVVKLWDLALQREIASWIFADGPYSGVSRPVLQLSFSPDDSVLAGVNSDGLLRIWRRIPEVRTQMDGALTDAVLRPPQAPVTAAMPIPRGWQWLENPEFAVGVDGAVKHAGKASLRLSNESALPSGRAILRQVFAADDWRRKLVRLDGHAKSELSSLVDHYSGRAGFGIRVMDHTGAILSSDSLEDRPISGSNDWRHFRLVVDVPKDATDIEIAASLTGIGKVWFDDLVLSVAGDARPSVSGFHPNFQAVPGQATLLNPDFESATIFPLPAHWIHGWEHSSFSESRNVNLVKDIRHGGTFAVQLHWGASPSTRPPLPFDSEWMHRVQGPQLNQPLSAAHYASHAVRVAAFVRTMPSTRAHMKVVALSADGKAIESRTNLVHQPEGEWREVALDLEVPTDAVFLQVSCELEEPGDVWFDDFQVREMPESSRSTPSGSLSQGVEPARIPDSPTAEPSPGPSPDVKDRKDSFTSLPGGESKRSMPKQRQVSDEFVRFADSMFLLAATHPHSVFGGLDGFVLGDAGSRICDSNRPASDAELRAYRISMEKFDPVGGQETTLRLESTDLCDQPYGFAIQTIPAGPYRGKRLRLGAELRSAKLSGFASLWIGTKECPDAHDLEGLKTNCLPGWSPMKANVGVDSLEALMRAPRQPSGVTGDGDWWRYSVELDVPETAQSITCGLVLVGEGTVWTKEPQIDILFAESEIVGMPSRRRTVPTAPLLPSTIQNPGFDRPDMSARVDARETAISGAPTGWAFTSRGDQHLVFSDLARTRTGTGSALIESLTQSGNREANGRLFQEVAATPYRGRRVRWSVYVRSALPSQIEIEGRIRDGSIGLLPAQRVTESFGRQTGEWKPVELVLDVPETADGILLSIGVRGAGKAWFDDARLRIASKDAPLSAQTDLDRAGRTDMPLRPSNLDFEQTDLR